MYIMLRTYGEAESCKMYLEYKSLVLTQNIISERPTVYRV